MLITKRLRCASLVMLGVVVATVVPAAVISAAAPASAASSKMLCHRYQHVAVQGVQPGKDGQAGPRSRYTVRNDFWGSTGMCMLNAGQQPNFRVVRAGRNQLGG